MSETRHKKRKKWTMKQNISAIGLFNGSHRVYRIISPVVAFRKLLERFGIISGKYCSLKSNALGIEEDTDTELAELMAEFAEEEGKKYIALNEQLLNTPTTEAPAYFKKRILELVDKN